MAPRDKGRRGPADDWTLPDDPEARIGMRSTPLRPHQFLRRPPVLVAVALLVFGLLGACADNFGGGDTSKPEGDVGAEGPRTLDPVIQRVSARQWGEMRRAGMLRPECPIQSRDQLRVVAINHYDFEERVRRGRLVVNADVAGSVVRIFSKLLKERFPIRRMQPVERYRGDTNASLRADNTSAYNCRRADQINAPFAESPHANGRAIDINPRENPWKDLRCDCWLPSPAQRERVEGPGKILRGGLVWRLFRNEGWIWQNIDVADYMHFDTGYPSRPVSSLEKP